MVVFGAQAVNAYVHEPRMTQDLDLLSTHAEGVAQALCDSLCVSGSTLRCASDVSATGVGCGCFRCGRRATGTWWICDASRRYRERSASRACW